MQKAIDSNDHNSFPRPSREIARNIYARRGGCTWAYTDRRTYDEWVEEVQRSRGIMPPVLRRSHNVVTASTVEGFCDLLRKEKFVRFVAEPEGGVVVVWCDAPEGAELDQILYHMVHIWAGQCSHLVGIEEGEERYWDRSALLTPYYLSFKESFKE